MSKNDRLNETKNAGRCNDGTTNVTIVNFTI